MTTYTYIGLLLRGKRTVNSISLGTKLGIFRGVTTTISLIILHDALQIWDKSLLVTTPARTRGHGEHCDYDDHVRRLSRQPGTSSLEAITYVVSRGSHVRRLS